MNVQLHTEIFSREFLPSVTTIGLFDRMRRRHRFLVEQIYEAAAVRGLAPSVIIFPAHPRKVVHPDFHSELLTTYDEETVLFAGTDIDYYTMLDFTPDLTRLSAKQFMAVLKDDCQVQALVVDYDRRSGHSHSEDFDDYVRHGQELGVGVILAQAYSNSEMTVSSSAIRHLLLEGGVSEAANCLGYHFFLNGTVVSGYHVGHKIGFPAVNPCVNDSEKLVPTNEVYTVNVFLGKAKRTGMLSIGYQPTLNSDLDHSIGMRIFHFSTDIYNQPIRISFIRRTRPELKFDSIKELIEQLHKDKAEIAAVPSLQ